MEETSDINIAKEWVSDKKHTIVIWVDVAGKPLFLKEHYLGQPCFMPVWDIYCKQSISDFMGICRKLNPLADEIINSTL